MYVKISDKLGEITILSLDEGSFRFFSDISRVEILFKLFK
jgi:hypothetical protein